jgi:ubiquinol-cytochrome c reductase cytochrome c subunit
MIRAFLVLPIALLLVGAVPAGAAGDDVSAGAQLFETACSTCHGANGRGTSQGPNLVGVGAAAADFYLSTGRMPTDQPGVQAVRKRPAFNPTQIRQITAYVASLGNGPTIPKPQPARGNIAEGQQLYTANCAACHNSAGSGGALGKSAFAPRLYEATPTQVAEAVRIGPGPMPVFNTGVISDRQLDSIVRYVEYLKHPKDRGGAPLGRIGPIPEGFVAWLAGLGVLLLVTLWIGTRT